MTGRIKILILLMIPLFFHGCDDMCDGCGTGTVRLNSYVTAYSEFKSFEVVLDGGITLKGKHHLEYRKYTFRNSESEIYNELCAKHSDVNFNKKYTYGTSSGPSSWFPTNYWSVDFVSVAVVSDSDWDAEHPAGTSLGDIAMFYSVSPYPYIKSGYTDTFDWDRYGLRSEFQAIFGVILSNNPPVKVGSYLHPVHKLVNDLVPSDLVLLGAFDVSTHYPFAHIKFTDLPTMDRNHKITVTLTADNGQEFSSSIAMSF